ncbi:isopentenyl-diphosphate delta-isomerase [Rhodococcus sp. SRB_17]|nr:isopentenyl-diphosphate delta-isomerase [Rhodococcus sp. SRB_17]
MSNVMLELVDVNGITTGFTEKISAHQAPGKLHRAFSVFLFDPSGRMLLQRRSAEKYHWPGVLSNACCGHPFPGESPINAAERRVFEELGVHAHLIAAGTVTYHHSDELSGLVEHEFNHLFLGSLTLPVKSNPAEVSETILVTASELSYFRNTDSFSGWFDTVFAVARPGFKSFSREAF